MLGNICTQASSSLAIRGITWNNLWQLHAAYPRRKICEVGLAQNFNCMPGPGIGHIFSLALMAGTRKQIECDLDSY